MTSNLHYIPDKAFDNVVNEKLEEADEAIISVSFVFLSGIDLIIENLRNFRNPSRLIVITSNYLSSSEPAALEKLLELKQQGAQIFLYDSISANRSFHMKSYFFSTNQSETLIVGSSNLSLTAFQKGLELNLSTQDLNVCKNFRRVIQSIISDPYTKPLSKEIVDAYREVYREASNVFLERLSGGIIFPNIVQSDALEILKSERELGLKKGLVVLATGLGKTFLSALDAKQFKANKVLFVAHREEILKQSLISYKRVMPEKTCGLYQAGNKDILSDFIFASIQTLGKPENLAQFKPDHFDYIVVDEFHHVGAKSYKNLVDYFKPKFFLGLTATPNRSDNIDILQYCGNNEIYRKDLIDGIDLELLCNFEYHGINDKFVDYTKITWRNKKFDLSELDESLNSDARTSYIYEKWESLKQSRTLGFCSTIKHCDHMSAYFNAKGYKTVAVHSQSAVNREDAINKLKGGEIDVLFTVDLFNEGVDIPEIDTLLMARPTESKIIFIQQLGRGLRLHSNKNLVMVIDFIGNHKSFLDKPAALFGFEPNNKNIKDFLEKYKVGKLELPKDSRILYDTETIDFMDQLSEIKVDYDHFYREYKESNGLRPSASDFYQFIGKLTDVRLRHGSWFDFIANMGDLSADEFLCFQKYKSFFRDFLEKTSMTLSFKMVTLKVMLENQFQPISLEELSRRSFFYLQGSIGLWNEVKSDLKFKDLDESGNLKKWMSYWRSNPIKALIETKPVFALNGDIFSLNFEVDSNLKSAFFRLSEELINYRLLSYVVRSDNSYIERGDPSLPFSSQIHKAFDKKDTPQLFGWDKFDQMTGFWHPENNTHQAIFITLMKSGFQVEHRYHDYFINEKTFHWQSKRSTNQSSKGALSLKSSEKITHLFVRKTDNMFLGSARVAAPFTYCGVLSKILSTTGNNPIQVEFELDQELPDRLKQEFLRI
jgi:superfamily II DNA or RNA helicase/HKD family nuclease